MPSIHRLINAGAWDEVREKLACDEKEVLFSSCYYNRHGATPFHLACARDDVPQDVVRAIMALDDDNLNARLKGNGATALHLACETGSAATVRTVLTLAEEAARDYALVEDENGWIALHVTWSRHLDPDEESYLGNELNVTEDPSEFLRTLGALNSPRELSGILRDTWDKTIMLLYTGTTGGFESPVSNGGQWNVLHSIAAAGGVDICNCPSIVLWLALKFFGAEQVRWKDEDGNLPLHVMASGEDLYRIEASESEEMDEEAKLIYDFTLEDPIEMLLRYNPDAAKIPNKEGRLPLHIQADSDTEMSARIAKLFIEAAPKSVDTRDPITGLFPFMLAAVDIVEDDEDYDGTELDAVYILLRENPENVQGGIFMTQYEKYLGDKLLEKETKNTELEEQRSKDQARIAELESRLAGMKKKHLAGMKRKHDDDCS